MTHFKFWSPSDISGIIEARVVKCYTQVLVDGGQGQMTHMMPAIIPPEQRS